MPSKPWRWTERLRATEGPPRPVQTMRLAEGEDPTPARLTELAAEQASGALYVNGRWGGTVFLVNGRIGHVESVLTPGVEALLLRPTYPSQRGWAEAIPTLRNGETGAAAAAAAALLRDSSRSAVEAEILRQTAMADAALATLGTVVPDAARTRVRFRPGEKHWYESNRT